MIASASPGSGVRVRSWCRADLAGGTLDIWPLGLLHPGSRTINVALDLAVEVELRPAADRYRVWQAGSRLEADSATELAASADGALVGLVAAELHLPPVDISIRSASPRGGGLGGSSALVVALIAAAEALQGRPESSTERRAALARDLEARLMGLPAGRQDHFPALLGGALEVRHEPGGERVRRLDVDLDELGRCLLVAYSGQSHFSAGHNWQIIRRRLDGDGDVARCLDGIRDAAERLSEKLERGLLEEVGRLMSREWSWRRRLATGISTPAIESLLAAAVEAGAWGGKACGAGGGGCIVVLCPAERSGDVARGLAAAGAQVLPAAPVDHPLQVEPAAALAPSRRESG